MKIRFKPFGPCGAEKERFRAEASWKIVGVYIAILLCECVYDAFNITYYDSKMAAEGKDAARRILEMPCNDKSLISISEYDKLYDRCRDLSIVSFYLL